MRYWINNCYGAIQGEGCLTGTPMVILRLHSCPVGCPFCDTKETWVVDPAHKVATLDEALGANERWCELSDPEIAYYLRQHYPTFRWVMVTGGEPAEQDLQVLCYALHDAGYKIALETSGTAAGLLNAGFDWVCVSPKINMPGGKAVLSEVLARADEIKHVVGRQRDITQLDTLLWGKVLKPGVQICLQPMSLSQRATELCIKTVQERGWRLSIQVHKYLNLP